MGFNQYNGIDGQLRIVNCVSLYAGAHAYHKSGNAVMGYQTRLVEDAPGRGAPFTFYCEDGIPGNYYIHGNVAIHDPAATDSGWGGDSSQPGFVNWGGFNLISSRGNASTTTNNGISTTSISPTVLTGINRNHYVANLTPNGSALENLAYAADLVWNVDFMGLPFVNTGGRVNAGIYGGNSSTPPIEDTVPDPPTSLAASSGLNAQIGLTWNAPGDNGGQPITSYSYQMRLSGGSYGTPVVVGGTSSHTVTGLTNGQEYEFQVRATNSIGSSSWSNMAAATPATIPNAPAITQATPGDSQVALTWSTPVANGSTISGYEVEYRLGAAAWGYSALTTWAEAVGNPLQGKDLANITLDDAPYAFRFVAPKTGSLTKVYPIWEEGPGDPPYGTGDGGTIRMRVVADDGNGFPDESTVLGSVPDWSPGLSGGVAGDLYPTIWGGHSLSSSVALTEGTTYHLTIENVDGNPGSNYISLNFLYTDYWNYDLAATAPRTGNDRPNLAPSEAEWGLTYRPSGSWLEHTQNPNDYYDRYEAPLLLEFTDGDVYGNLMMTTYNQSGPYSYGYLPCGGSNRARELFTPQADVTVDSVMFHAYRSGDGGAASPGPTVTAKLKQGASTLATATHYFDTRSATGRDGTFNVSKAAVVALSSSVDLTAGTTYSVEFSSSSSDAEVPIGAYYSGGTDRPQETVTSFAENGSHYAQESTDSGATWQTVSGGSTATHIAGLAFGRQSLGGGLTTETETVITGLANGSEYQFRVRASSNVGYSEYSAIATATPSSSLNVPEAINDLGATFTTTGPSEVNFELTWTEPGGGAATNYWIYYRAAGPNLVYGSWYLVNTNSASTTYNLTTAAGYTYQFYAVAVNSEGSSAASNTVTVEAFIRPTPPLNLSSLSGDSEVVLEWGAPQYDNGSPVTSYKIQVASTLGVWSDLTTTANLTYTHALANGEVRYYQVAAINAEGTSDYSNYVIGQPGAFNVGFSGSGTVFATIRRDVAASAALSGTSVFGGTGSTTTVDLSATISGSSNFFAAKFDADLSVALMGSGTVTAVPSDVVTQQTLAVWNGSEWKFGNLKVWNGTAWVDSTPHVFDGSSWS